MQARHAMTAVALAVVVACATSHSRPAPATAPVDAQVTPVPAAPVEPVNAPPAVSFEASIRPLLARRCTPCHVPGGRMYERMPFDDPGVVRSHREGIARRLKDEDEKRLLERWLESDAHDPQATRSRPASLAQ
jgi:hypothetical protein